MATNQVNERGVRLTMPVPIAANAGVGPISGDPLMFGNPSAPFGGGVSSRMMAGVAQTSYTPPAGMGIANPDGISVHFEGVFLLSVAAAHSLSPATSTAIGIGDPVYAGGNGTYDATTGCYYGFTLNADSANGHYFGNSLDAVAAGLTATIRVRLKVSG
jgi:hypothetical protein